MKHDSSAVGREAVYGLSSSEVKQRRQQGLGMLLVGDTRPAITTVGLVVFKATIGIIQEIGAKRQLDEIALLARVESTVIRDGREQQVYPDELVLDDVLVIEPGDQIPVDGKIVGDGRIEFDESALTGESDLVQKSPGDDVLSGSFCVTSQTLMEATAVGEEFNDAAILVSAQTALVIFFVFSGITIMLFAETPIKWFAGGAPYHGRNLLPPIAAVALLAIFFLIMALPRVRSFFQLVPFTVDLVPRLTITILD